MEPVRFDSLDLLVAWARGVEGLHAFEDPDVVSVRHLRHLGGGVEATRFALSGTLRELLASSAQTSAWRPLAVLPTVEFVIEKIGVEWESDAMRVAHLAVSARAERMREFAHSDTVTVCTLQTPAELLLESFPWVELLCPVEPY